MAPVAHEVNSGGAGAIGHSKSVADTRIHSQFLMDRFDVHISTVGSAQAYV